MEYEGELVPTESFTLEAAQNPYTRLNRGAIDGWELQQRLITARCQYPSRWNHNSTADLSTISTCDSEIAGLP